MNYQQLPLKENFETTSIFKALTKAHKNLGELKGIANIIPNKKILLDLLPIQEAKYSSEIENIVTTQDDLFRSKIENNLPANVKEVQNYTKALIRGFEIIKHSNLLTNNNIIEIQNIVKQTDYKFRTQEGTKLKNNLGEIIYTPPQDKDEVEKLMNNLEEFINNDEMQDLDPLIKMAIIHHRFESIHPFYDGNGRVGRIINILYLILKKQLDYPILYLSRYIIKNKSSYYRLLQEVRDKNNWEEWIIYLLEGISYSSLEAVRFIKDITDLMKEFKQKIRTKYKNIYSQDLINSLFKYPYTKIDFISKDLNITRKTARKYLEIFVAENLFDKVKVGKSFYYVNKSLINKHG